MHTRHILLKRPSMLLGGRIDFVQVKKKTQTTEFSNNEKKNMVKTGQCKCF